MNLPNIEDFTLANYPGVETYGMEEPAEESVQLENPNQLIEVQQPAAQLTRRVEADLRTTADTSSAQAKSDRANYKNMGSKSPTSKMKQPETSGRVHSIEKTIDSSKDEKKLRFEKMRSQAAGKSCSQITRAKTLNMKDMDSLIPNVLDCAQTNTSTSFTVSKALETLNRSLLPLETQDKPNNLLTETTFSGSDQHCKNELIDPKQAVGTFESKYLLEKKPFQSKGLDTSKHENFRRFMPIFELNPERTVVQKPTLTQSLTQQLGDSQNELANSNLSETERGVLLERPRDWKAATLNSMSGAKKTHQSALANKSSNQINDFSGSIKLKEEPSPLYSKDFGKTMLTRFKNTSINKPQDLLTHQHLERRTLEPFQNSSILTQTADCSSQNPVGGVSDSKGAMAATDRIKSAKGFANSSERSLKKQGSSSSNKSISLIENLHSRLNRKFSNRSITKLGESKKEAGGRRTLVSQTDTSSRGDSTSSTAHKVGGMGHLSSDLNIYSQPAKKDHSPAAHFHNSKHYYERLSREGRKILGINRTTSNTGSVGKMSDSVSSIGRENPSLNIYRSKK